MRPLRFVRAAGAVSDAGELLGALAAEARAAGAEVDECRGFPADEGDHLCVFSPGDVFGIPGERKPSPAALRRAIAVCEAAPGGALDPAYLHARRCAGALVADPGGAVDLQRRGVPTLLLEPGFTAGWEASSTPSAERDVDVACLSARNRDADRLLASFASTLWKRHSVLLGAPEAAVVAGAEERVPPLAIGPERLDLLRRTSVLLIGVGAEGDSVERIRALQAAISGAVVVAAHGCDLAPLQSGADYLVAEPRNLALVADGLLRDPGRLEEVRRSAAKRVRERQGNWEEALEWIRSRVSPRERARRTAVLAASQARLNSLRDTARVTLRPPPNPSRVGQKREALAEIAARRQAAAGEPREVFRTKAWEEARPKVSVCIPVYEHEEVLRRALRSVAGSELAELEVLILDDASTGPTVDRAREWLTEHEWLPGLLLSRESNRGVGAGRNDLARHARGDLLFMLDADNEVYPTALTRLAEALDADAESAFAYSLIETHTAGRPRALLSAAPWEPSRLRLGNYIDAMSMIRRDALLDAGGYTEDLALHGWEDFDLWCRFAALGLRGRLVPEILCRYSFAEGSMIATTNLDSSEAWAMLRDRYPSVLGGAPEPVYPPPPPDIEV